MSDRFGIGDLGGYPLTDKRFQCVGRHQVDGSAEAEREVFLEFDEGEETDRPGELNKDIDIACLGLLAACDRSVDTDPADREPRKEFAFEPLQSREDLFPGMHGNWYSV